MKSLKLSLLFSLTCILLGSPLLLFAQIKMGDSPLSINPYAIFEIESHTQGVLLPRMTTAERDAAFNGTTPHGLLIFNTTTNKFEYFNANERLWIGLQSSLLQLNLEDHLLSLSGSKTIDLSLYLDNTDQQQLSLSGNKLHLEKGGEVDLSPLLNNFKDEQQLYLEDNLLSLERGGSIDLSTLIISQSPQQIDQFEVVSNTLYLSLTESDQAPARVQLPLTTTAPQQLSLSGNQLVLEKGGEVDLSPLLNNFKDEQQLYLEDNILSLERGGSIDLNELDFEDLDEQELYITIPNSSTLKLEITNGNELTLTASGNIRFLPLEKNRVIIQSDSSPFSEKDEVISNKDQNWSEADFVFGSPQLGNNPDTTNDNKRLFFDKSKGAFRVGMAQSDQWDEDNIGTYSVAMGRNTIASGYHATAFGLNTHAKAWYTTTLGQGTSAESRSETVLGSYNTLYTPEGGTRDWHPNDRLFVIGNGTSDAIKNRKDALIIFKNGRGLTSADWTGPGFLKLSDSRLKENIRSLGKVKSKLLQLRPVQFNNKNANEKIHYGFLAQEVEKIFPALVSTVPGTTGLQSIDYLALIPLLLAAVQAQEEELRSLKKKLERN